MKRERRKSIDQLFRECAAIDAALAQAAADAARRHKLLGHPLWVWKDGRVTSILPDQIVVDGSEIKSVPARRRSNARKPRRAAEKSHGAARRRARRTNPKSKT